jgi:hypothetical protein
MKANDMQKQAMSEAEKVINSYSPNAQRANKTVRGFQIALNAARVVTGMFAEYASEKDIERSNKFFALYEEGGLNAVGAAFAYEH